MRAQPREWRERADLWCALFINDNWNQSRAVNIALILFSARRINFVRCVSLTRTLKCFLFVFRFSVSLRGYRSFPNFDAFPVSTYLLVPVLSNFPAEWLGDDFNTEIIQSLVRTGKNFFPMLMREVLYSSLTRLKDPPVSCVYFRSSSEKNKVKSTSFFFFFRRTARVRKLWVIIFWW